MFAIVLLIFSICNSLFIESRVSDAAAAPSIPLVPKKPPFNGSIYGKRSSWPALRGIQDFSDYSNQELSYLQNLASGISDSPVAIMMKQQQFEAAADLIRAAVNLCLSEQQISNTGESHLFKTKANHLLAWLLINLILIRGQFMRGIDREQAGGIKEESSGRPLVGTFDGPKVSQLPVKSEVRSSAWLEYLVSSSCLRELLLRSSINV